MDKSPQRVSQEIASKIKLIESLIEQKKFKEALAEIRDLESQKITDQFSIERGHIHYLLSLTFHHLGRYEEGLAEGRKAFDFFKKTSENGKIAQIQFALGNIYVALGDFEKAESEFRDALTTYRRIENKQGIIKVYNKLANICFINSHFDKAIKYLNQCIDCCDESGEKTTKAKLAANLSRIYIRIGKWQPAQESLLSAIKVFEENGDKLSLCRGLLSLSYVSYLQRDFKKAEKYYAQTVKIIFENNYTREFAIYHEYSGELQFAQGNYENAKNHYLDAIGIGQQIAPEGDIVSQTYRLLAELQIAEKQYDEALSSCEKALWVAESLGEKIEIGAIHRALGQIYTVKKERGKAKENFEKSISILEQIGAKFELGKTYLEAVKSNIFEYFDRVAYFANTREVFKELESDYYVGKVTLAFCEMLFDNCEYEKAEVYLKDAEKIFKRLNEKRDLDSLLELKEKISRILGKEECADDSKTKYTFANIITKNKEMLKIIEEIKRAKDSDLPILLEGETGTGKDLFAKTIHHQSKRRDKRFVPVNCSALPETLLENELFGHKRGAYTGADKDEPGLFEEAEGGTFYFDEIGEVPLSTQVKLLRVIEEKEVTRLGETRPKKVNVRIIASTSRNLKEMVLEESFRKDLYHRLNIFNFRLPALRERKEDISLLIEYFLKEDKVSERFSAIFNDPKVMQEFLDYDWQGNVRELKHEIERLAISTTDMEKITPQLLLERIINLKNGESKKAPGSLFDEVAEFEKRKIVRALEESGGIKSRAAKVLGIPETSLWNKLKKYKIE
jgi:transcriptional regulator with PAS, ATPase and Fis domain/Tfp pilus assembly protein PilF